MCMFLFEFEIKQFFKLLSQYFLNTSCFVFVFLDGVSIAVESDNKEQTYTQFEPTKEWKTVQEGDFFFKQAMKICQHYLWFWISIST